MIDLRTNNSSIVADNKVVIGGLEYMLTDDEVIKVNDIINGLISTRGQQSTPKATPKVEVVVKSTPKADGKEFPNLGTPTCTIGFVTAYKTLVRYWENGFVPSKVKYGIKQSLKDAGAVWDKANGAFSFPTLKACNEWLKAQKARQSK